MELWDLYTPDRKIVGRHIRGNEMPPDRYHLVVHVWIRNAGGKYLMTQRSASRASCPLKWECVGGAVVQGETSLEAALREVAEEVGLTFAEKDCRLVTTKVRGMVEGRRINDIVDVYLISYDGPVDLAAASTDEVAQAKWMDREEIERLFTQGEMVRVIKDLSYFLDRTEGALPKT